jgi:glyoxylase-like metal-dependent hydrolase (beta-lactamase superfamily II)
VLLTRFYDDKLAQASYLLGCEVTGEALVVDPNRDADQYVRTAKAADMRITHVAETHIHADFVSGSRELVRRTGATLYLSAEGGDAWRYLYGQEDGARLLKGGDTFDVGTVRIEAWHTPGHTPEHLSFVVTDTHGADRPMGIFTGDFVFVGDVGRPDLLERAARVAGTMEAAARTLFASLQQFKRQPDYLQVWPAHGAGSACGKSLSAMPQSTVGYELRFNWALAVANEDEFVRQVLAGQPDPPKYFAEMKRVNRDGPRVLGGFSKPPRVDPARLEEVIASGAIVVDTRRTADHGAGHVARTINIPFNAWFTTIEPGEVPPGPWDVVTILDVLYLLGEADAEALLTRVAAELAPSGTLIVKEADIRPRWKHWLATAQEHLATRVLRITEGTKVRMLGRETMEALLCRQGLVPEGQRLDQRRLHPHYLVVGEQPSAQGRRRALGAVAPLSHLAVELTPATHEAMALAAVA